MIDKDHDDSWRNAEVSVTGHQGLTPGLKRFHGPNMVRCEDVTDRKRTPIIGACLLTSNLEHLTDLDEALARFCD